MRIVSKLESQLKLLSASTLSMSSSSSLGSLSSSHASSKGSLSSLSFTDIYGLSTTTPADPAMLDLHRRVDKILNNQDPSGRHQSLLPHQHQQQQQLQSSKTPVSAAMSSSSVAGGSGQESGMVSAEESLTTPESETSSSSFLQQPGLGAAATATSQPQPSLSPRSSLSSVSPPVSPHDALNMPPSYDQAFLGSAERSRRILHTPSASVPAVSGPSSNKLSTIEENTHNHKIGLELEDLLKQHYSSSSSGLDPISEHVATSVGAATTSSGGGGAVSKASSSDPRSVSAAVSDESVAGDSGVYEAVSRPSHHSHQQHQTASSSSAVGGGCSSAATTLASMGNLETAQVQIKLRYALQDSLLHVGVERARNLAALSTPDQGKIFIKVSLYPPSSSGASVGGNISFCTRPISNLSKATFGESFPLSVSKGKLASKTLQVAIWSINVEGRKEECLCLGCAQVSLADFDPLAPAGAKWYNVLSFHFMHQPSASPEEVNSPKHHHPQQQQQLHRKQESELSSGVNSKQGTLKEESSDESTIISSQTSTLTRNVGPEAMMMMAAAQGVGTVATDIQVTAIK